jgi:hypothetical protein
LKVKRRISRVWSVYQSVGFAAFMGRIVNKVRSGTGLLSPSQAAYLRKIAEVDREFDAVHGVSTGGIEHLYDFEITGPNAHFGISHIASVPSEFERCMNALDVDFKDFTFIDLGSGKGRALILAAAYPFSRLIGVEFAAELYLAAKENFAARATRGQSDDRIELVHGDVTLYEFPTSPLVLYLFNPFEAAVVGDVARRTFASWNAHPRLMRVVYNNPLHASQWTDAGWQTAAGGEGFVIFQLP